MFLRHGCLSPVENIIYQLFTIRHIYLAAVIVCCLFLVDKKQVVASFPPGNVNIFSDLYITVGIVLLIAGFVKFLA